jgi:hypothetical protein
MTLLEAKKQAKAICKMFGDTVWVYKSKNMKDTYGTILSEPKPHIHSNVGYFVKADYPVWFDGTAVQL